MKISGEKLRIARHLAGYSTTDLAKLLGVSKQSLSQYESGTEIKPDIYFKLINILNCDKSFLENPIINEFEIKNTFFRATASANASERNYQQTKTTLVCQIYYYLSNYFDFPQLNLPLFPEEATIEEKAMILRNHWGLGSNPIRNMIKHLENNGIIVSTFNSSNSEESEKIDGYTQQFKLKKEQNDSYQYCIIVENDKRSLFRKTFSLAHELGHVVLHGNDDYMEKTKTEQTQVEKQANEFAAAFLLPRDEFVKDVKGIRTLDDFIKLKSKWFVSIGAMMLRARDLHCITSEDYLKLIKNYSA